MMLENILTLNFRSKTFGYLVTDLLIISAIYILPTLSHLTSIPFYLFEPMRLGIVFCIINTNQKNSLIIALTVPIISFIISSHPFFAKSILITGELTINVLLFYIISKRFNNKFIVMLVSILVAKMFYYTGKMFFIQFGLLDNNLFTTPLLIQYLMMILFSIYAAFALRDEHRS
jgi:hypothetical protein